MDRYYSIRDALSRIVEVGQIQTTQSLSDLYPNNSRQVDETAFENFIANGKKTEITKTLYDISAPVSVPNFTQENLRNRVSAAYYYAVDGGSWEHATFYSYDIHGNVQSLVQDNALLVGTPVESQRFKRIDYQYDLLSGNTNYVSYQSGQPDQFFHHFEYDADNRITQVYSSLDSVLWDRDAQYEYYLNGPLGRTEYGDIGVQGMDYTFTLQGWIKGVNSNTLDSTRDMGKDGLGTGLHAAIPKDAFGYSLNYYSGDYLPVGTGANSFLASTSALDADLKKTAPDLFNGNITSMVTTITDADPTSNTKGQALPQLTAYKYDQLQRIKQMQAYHNISLSSNAWLSGNDGRYGEHYSYDGNGNILTLSRRDENGDPMDSLTYYYETINNNFKTNTNRLSYVTDAVPANEHKDDIDSQKKGNYTYDASGNLASDSAEGIAKITWYVTNKVKEIIRVDTSSAADLEFKYDATGNRVAKIVKHGPNKTDPTNWTTTCYVLDSKGMTLATYTLQKDTLYLSEQVVYGSKRLGQRKVWINLLDTAINPLQQMYNRTIGLKLYEGSNHLSNVLTTFSDRKRFTGSSYLADIHSSQSYYSFGMLMPGRNFSASSYAYGFNGQRMDNEIYGTGNAYTAEYWEYDPRTGKRWNLDPKFKKMPWESPYGVMMNNPILLQDPNGDCPVCIILIGLLTLPSVAVAPTGHPSDNVAIANAKKLQYKWLVYTFTMSGIASGAISKDLLVNELGGQFTVQALSNAATQFASKGEIDLKKVAFDSFGSLDIADALFSKLKAPELVKDILAASIDVTPEEAGVLGLNKDVKSVTVDFVVSRISKHLEQKVPRGKYSSIVDKIRQVGENKTADYLKESDSELNNNTFEHSKIVTVPDKTKVATPPRKTPIIVGND